MTPPHMRSPDGPPGLYAVSDLHVGYPENRALMESIWPTTPGDWLIVAGDVADTVADVVGALSLLRERYARVIWAPGNHELWTVARDPVRSTGVARYEHLVHRCQEIGVDTPEDPFPLWSHSGVPTRVAPMLLLYDYSFAAAPGRWREAVSGALDTGVVCTDEFVLKPDPYPDIVEWCRARVAQTAVRLAALGGEPTVLVNHFPMLREHIAILRHAQLALWCGTAETEDWHRRFNARAVVYGHLHIPRQTRHDGVAFHEVSLGYPKERDHDRGGGFAPCRIL